MSDTLFTRLDREWDFILRSSAWRRFDRRLAADPRLESLRSHDPAPVLRDLGISAPAAADAACRALLELGVDEPLAQRTLLQSIVPPLCRIAAWPGRTVIESDLWERSTSLVSIAALRIASFPVERRRRNIAANIVLDTRRDFVREQDALRPGTAITEHVERSLGDERAERALALVEHRDELIAVVRQASDIGQLSDPELVMLIDTRVYDGPVEDHAAQFGLNRSAMLRARSRLERRLHLVAAGQQADWTAAELAGRAA